jgi:hypothetical protein
MRDKSNALDKHYLFFPIRANLGNQSCGSLNGSKNNYFYYRWFDRFITLIILINTILLTMQDYSFRLTNAQTDAGTINNVFINSHIFKSSHFRIYLTTFLVQFSY